MLDLIYHAVGQGQSKLVCTTQNSQEIKRKFWQISLRESHNFNYCIPKMI